MKKINRLIGLLLIFLGIFTISSCGNDIEAEMEYTASTTTITITTTFAANSDLGSSIKARIRQYSFDDDGNEKYDYVEKTLSFSESTTKDITTFDGLEKDTKYLFKLYVTESNTDKLITTLEARTNSIGDDDAPIEIKTASDFLLMNENPKGNYILANDIEFYDDITQESTTFVYQFSESKPFEGTFNGNNKKISNLKLPTGSFMGIFNYTKGAKIYDLKLENITAEVSQKTDMGALIGHAKETEVSNIILTDISLKAGGAKSYVVYVGGVVGAAEDSNFSNVNATNVSIEYSYISRDLKVGLFAGYITGDSLKKIEINGVETAFATNECSAQGTIKGCNWVNASDTTANINVHVGGFIGHLCSKSVVYNSYVESDIDLNCDTKNTSKPNYNLYAGGFIGLANGNAVINSVFANSDISLSSGVTVNADTEQDVIDEINNTALVSKSGIVRIAGFVGAFTQYIGKVINSYYMEKANGVNVYALSTRTATDTEKEDFIRVYGELNTLAAEEVKTIDSIEYKVAGSYYYEVEANEITLDSSTFIEDKYYTLVGTSYYLANSFDSTETYYEIESTKVEIKDQATFEGNKYYNYSDNIYSVAISYTERKLITTYLYSGELYAYIYTNTGKLDNLSQYNLGDDVSSYLKEFVLNYVNSLN